MSQQRQQIRELIGESNLKTLERSGYSVIKPEDIAESAGVLVCETCTKLAELFGTDVDSLVESAQKTLNELQAAGSALDLSLKDLTAAREDKAVLESRLIAAAEINATLQAQLAALIPSESSDQSDPSPAEGDPAPTPDNPNPEPLPKKNKKK